MKIKNDAKIEENLTCQFKTDMRNLMIFHSSTWKSKKFALQWDAFDQTKAKESTEELFFIALQIDAKFEGKLACTF